MSVPRVTAIIVTYHSARTVGAALESLRTAHERGQLDCVVVDNDSDDNTKELVQCEHPWVRVVEAGDNLGFGRANNLGLEHVDTPYVLLLNPDAALGYDDLQKLVGFLQHDQKTAVCGPVIDNGDGPPQLLHAFPTPGMVVRDALGRPRAEERPRPMVTASAPYKVDWLCGAALLARTEVLRELEGFDPRFFLYFEETDLCYRLHQAGHKVCVVPNATAHHQTHHSARSTNAALYHGCIAEHYFQSRYYYLRKHFGAGKAVGAELADLLFTGARTLARWVRGRAAGDLLVRLRAPHFRAPIA